MSKNSGKTKTLVITAAMAAVMAVLSPMAIPIGPVPLTLGVFAVCLAGVLLPVWQAVASLSVYLLLGAVGLPVFSGFRGGPQVLLGPTGGYLFGYYILVLGLALAVAHTDKLHWQGLAALLSLVLFYLAGTLWYCAVTDNSFVSGLAVCVVPFIVPDILKMAAAIALGKVLKLRMQKAGLR